MILSTTEIVPAASAVATALDAEAWPATVAAHHGADSDVDHDAESEPAGCSCWLVTLEGRGPNAAHEPHVSVAVIAEDDATGACIAVEAIDAMPHRTITGDAGAARWLTPSGRAALREYVSAIARRAEMLHPNGLAAVVPLLADTAVCLHRLPRGHGSLADQLRSAAGAHLPETTPLPRCY